MATSDPPALTVGDVVRLGGWHPLYARVRALVSVGSEAVSVTDGNGDMVELEVEQWTYEDGDWRPGGSVGDRFHKGRSTLLFGADNHLQATVRYDGSDDLLPDSTTQVGVLVEVTEVELT